MKTRITTLAILVILFTLAACGSGDHSGGHEAADATHTMPDGTTMEGHEHMDGATAGTEAMQPRMVDGVQVAEIEAGRMGYDPGMVHLDADIPAQLIFTRTVDSECSSQIQIPAFDVPATDLPLGEPVAIEFTPSDSGDFTFVCGMDMQSGTLMVEG